MAGSKKGKRMTPTPPQGDTPDPFADPSPQTTATSPEETTQKKKNFYEQYAQRIAPQRTDSTQPGPATTGNAHDSDSEDDEAADPFATDEAGLLASKTPLNSPVNAIKPSNAAAESTAKVQDTDAVDEDEEFNPEAMLYAAADDVYFSTKRKRSMATIKSSFGSQRPGSVRSARSAAGPAREVERNPFKRVAGWYRPVYDYRSPNLTEEERRKPRYCGGALKKWQFICVHFAAVAMFGEFERVLRNVSPSTNNMLTPLSPKSIPPQKKVTLVMLPIMYFIIIPMIIQDVLDKTSFDTISLQGVDVDQFSTTQVGLRMRASIPPPTIFPVKAGIGDLTLELKDEQENLLMDALLPGMEFTLNQVVALDSRANVSFARSNTRALVQLVKDFSTKGLNDRKFIARTKAKVMMYGITIYPALPLYKKLPITGISNNVLQLWSSLPSFTRIPTNEMNTPNENRAKDLLQNAYADKLEELITFTNSSLFPPIVLKSLDIQATDDGLDLGVGIEFQNPTKITLSNFESAEVGFQLNGSPLARIKISQLALKPQLQTLDLKATLKFNTTDPASVVKALGDAVSSMLDGTGKDASLSIVGPLVLTQVGYVQTFTDDFVVNLPGTDIISSINFDQIKSLLTPEGLANIVGNSTFAATVRSDDISVRAAVGLPRLLPLPATIRWPHDTSLKVFGNVAASAATPSWARMLGLALGPVTVRTDKKGIVVDTTLDLRLENSTQAADALAAVVNPILAAQPQDAQVAVGEVSITQPNATTPFAWTTKLFDAGSSGGKIAVKVPKGSIKTTDLIDVLTQNETSLPLEIKRLALEQLTDAAGFGAKGAVAIKLPSGQIAELAANVTVDIGFAGVSLLVDGQALADAGLTTGLKISSLADLANGTNLDARLVMAPKSDALTTALQSLLDAVLGTLDGKSAESSTSRIGVTGIRFGPSADKPYITFSKVVAEIPAAHVMPLVNRTVDGLKGAILKPQLLTVSSMDLAVASATNVTVGADVAVNNPSPVSLSVGALSATAALDGLVVASAALPPLAVPTGAGNVSLDAGLTLSNGADGLADKVAAVVDALMTSPLDLSKLPAIGLRNVVIAAPGNASAAAAIDQLQGVSITLPASLIKSFVPTSLLTGTGGLFDLNETSWLNLAPVLPTPERLNGLSVTPRQLGLDVLAGAGLRTFVNADYVNPLAISASVPRAQLGVLVGASNAPIAINASNVAIVRGAGTAAATLAVGFPNDEAVATALARIVQGVVNEGKLPADVPVKAVGVRFSGERDEATPSELLAKVVLDVLALVKDLDVRKLVADIINKVLPFALPASLEDVTTFAKSSLQGASGSLSVETRPQKSLGIKVPQITLKLPFQLEAQVGFADVAIGINGHPLLEVVLSEGLKAEAVGDGMTRLTIPGLVFAFVDEELTREDVANLVNAFLDGTDFKGFKVGITKLVIGASTTDTIQALSKVSLDIAVDDVLKPTQRTDVEALLNTFETTLTGDVGITPQSGNRLGVKANVGLKLPISVEANIGYLGADAGLDGNPLATVLLPQGLVVKPDGANGTSALAIDTSLQMTDNEATQTSVNRVVNRLLNGQNLEASANVASVKVGVSASDYLTVLDKVSLSLDLDAGVRLLLGTSAADAFDIKKIAANLNPALGATTVVVKPSKVLDVETGVVVNLNLPVAISFNAGYLAADAGLSSNPLAAFTLPGFELQAAQNERTALRVTASARFTDTEGTQDALAALVDNFFKGSMLQATLDLSKVAVGVSATDTLSVLSKLDVKLNLDTLVDAVYPRAGAVNILGLLGDFKPKVEGELGLETQAGNKLGVSTALTLTLPFPLTATVPYLSTDIGLDSNPLAILALAQGISLKSNDKNELPVSVTTALQFTDNDATRTAVAELVNRVLNLKTLGSSINIAGLAVGASAQDTITALRKVSLPVDLDGAVSLLLGKSVGEAFDLKTILGDFNPSIGNTAVAVKPSKVLSLDTAVEFTLNLPMKISFKAGVFGAQTGISGNPLAGFTLPGLTLSNASANRTALAVKTDVQFNDNEGTQNALAALVDNFFKGSKLGATLDLSNVVVGASASDVLTVLSKLNVKLDIDPVLDAVYPRSGPVQVLSLLGDFKPTIEGEVGLETQPSNRLGVSTALTLALPIRISAAVPYISTDLGLDSHPLAVFALAQGLTVASNDRNQLPLSVNTALQFTDNEETRNTVAAMVERFLSTQKLGAAVSIANLVIGASAQDSITALRKVTVPIDLDSAVSLLLGTTAGEALDLKKILGDLNPSIGNTAVAVKPSKVLSLDTGFEFNLNLPFKISFKAGVLGAQTGIGGNPLASFALPGLTLSNAASNRTALAVKTDVQFNDNDATQNALAALVDNFLKGNKLATTLDLSNLVVGASATDVLTIVSKLNVKLDIDPVLDAVYPRSGPVNILSLLGDFKPTVEGEIGLETQPSNKLGVSTALTLTLPIRISATLPYLSTDLGLDSHPLAVFALAQGLSVATNDRNQLPLSINTALQFTDNDNTRNSVAALVDRFLKTQQLGASLNIANLVIGASAQDSITALRKVSIPVDLDSAVKVLLGAPASEALDLKKVLKDLNPSVGNTGVVVKPSKVLSVDTALEFTLNLPFRISFKAGVLGAQTGIGGNPLASFALPGLSLSNASANRTALALKTDLQFNDNDGTQNALAAVVDNFLKGNKLATTLDLSNLAVGASASDMLTILSKLNVKLDLDPVLDAVYPRSGPVDLLSLLGDFKPSINGEIGLATQPSNRLGVTTALSLTLPIRISATVPYLSTDLSLDSHPLAVFALAEGLTVAANEKGELPLRLTTALQFTDNDDTRNSVAALVSRFLDTQKLGASLNIGSLVLGATAQDTITALRKVSIPVDLDSALRILLGTEAGEAFDLKKIIGNLNPSIGATSVAVKPSKVLSVDTGVEFTFNLPAKISFRAGVLGAQTGISGNPLAGFVLPGFELSNAAGNRTALAVKTDVQFNDNDATQTALATLVDNFTKGSKLDSTLDLSNLVVGASATDVLTIFSKLNVKINLDWIVDAVYPRNGPVNLLALLSDFKPNVDGEIGLTTQSGNRLGVSTALTLTLPIKISATLPYLSTDLGLDSHPLAVFALAEGLSLASNDRNQVPLRVNTALQFTDNDDTRNSVAAMVDRLLSTQKLGATLNIAGLAIGASAQDTITALRKVSIPIDLDAAVSLLLGTTAGEAFDLKKIIGNLDPKIGATTVVVKPAKSLELDSALEFTLSLPAKISFKAGILAAQAGISGNPLASVSLPGIDLSNASGNRTSLAAKAGLQFNDNDATQTALAIVVDRFFKGEKLASTVDMSSLAVGVSASDTLTVLSKLNIKLDLDLVLDAIYPRTGPIDVFTLLKDFKPSIDGEASIAPAASNSLSIGLGLLLNLPFRLTATVPYLSASAGLNDFPLMDIPLPGGLSIAGNDQNQAPLRVNTTARFTDNEGTQEAVATLINRFAASQALDTKVYAGSLAIGASAQDTITALSKVKLVLDLDNAIKFLTGIDTTTISLPEIAKKANVTLSPVGLNTLPNKALSTNVTVGFELDLPIKLKATVGYMSLTGTLGGEPLLATALNNLALSTAGERESLNINTVLNMIDNEKTQQILADVVRRFLDGSKLDTKAGVTDLKVGVSATDLLTVLSKVNLNLDLDPLVDAIFPRSGPFDIDGIALGILEKLPWETKNGTLPLGLKDLSVDTLPGDKINSTVVLLLDPWPLPIRFYGNIEWFKIHEISVEGVPAATIYGSMIIQENGEIHGHIFGEIFDTDALRQKLKEMCDRIKAGNYKVGFGLKTFEIGHSPTDYITGFLKIDIQFFLEKVIKFIVDKLNQLVDQFLANIPAGQLGDIGKGGPITVNLGQGIEIVLNNLDAKLAANDNINIRLDAGLKFPFSVQATVPYFTVELDLDEVKAIGTRVQGINVKGGSVSQLNLGAGLSVFDSDPLADRVAAIASAFFGSKDLPGNLRLVGVTIGVSAEDSITALSDVAIDLALNRLAAPFLKGIDTNIDVFALLERFGFQLGNINAKTSPGRSIDAGVSAKINNIFPLSAEVPYLGLAIGLDDVDVATTSIADVKITPSAQNLNLNTKLTFPSSPQIQSKVGNFASTLLKNGWGSTSEAIAASGIVFGVSKDDSITALSKARILLPSKTLLTQKNAEALLKMIGLSSGDLTVDGLLKRLDVRGVNLDASQQGKVRADASIGLKGLALSASADIGFAGLTATLDSNRLGDAAIPSGFSVRTVDGSVLLNLGVDLYLGSGESLQNAVAKLVEAFADQAKAFTSMGGASKVVFGASSDDYIDTLAAASLELDLKPILEPARKLVFDLIDGVLKGTSQYKLNLNNVDVFWVSTTAIGASLNAGITGLPGNITAKVPFLGLKAKINNQDFIVPIVQDFVFQSGTASAKANLGFIKNAEVAQRLTVLIGDVVFHRQGPVDILATAYGIVFGPSQESAYDLAAKASVSVHLDSIISQTKQFFDTQRPLELLDIQSEIRNQGIFAKIRCTTLPSWLPLNVNFGTVVGQVIWRINAVGEPYKIVDAIFTNLVVKPNQPITFDLLMAPDGDSYLTPLSEAIPLLIQFKDYAKNAWLGRVDVYEKGIEKGKSFDVLSTGEFEAPDLYLWRPITIKPVFSNPITRSGLQFKVLVYWPNPGPLRLDVGALSVRLESEGSALLKLESPGPVIVKNVNEGANENNGINGLVNNLLSITIPWSNFNPLVLFENLLDLLHPAQNFKLIIETIRPGEGPIKWINAGLEQLPKEVVENLVPTVVALLANVKIEVFGITLSASLIPGFNRFIKEAQARLDAFPTNEWRFVNDL
ncbi:hypothetical protein HDU96_008274 [Phlyctochytrium bullatum]|nr:hypothetical protein HDU96_008274 [Phlyctochytrium bullatum]